MTARGRIIFSFKVNPIEVSDSEVRLVNRKSHFFMQDKSCYKLGKNYVL